MKPLKKSILTQDIRKCNADIRRFIIRSICDYLRAPLGNLFKQAGSRMQFHSLGGTICENLRSRKFFQVPHLEITKRIFLFLIIIILSGLLQTAFLDYISVFNGRPNLFIISVLMASLFFKLRWAIFLSIFSGILKDALSQNSFGVNTLLFPLCSFLALRLSKEIPIDNNFIRAVCVFIFVAINDIIAMIMLLFLGTSVNWGVFLRIVSIDSLYTASVLPLVFKVVMPALYPYTNKSSR